MEELILNLVYHPGLQHSDFMLICPGPPARLSSSNSVSTGMGHSRTKHLATNRVVLQTELYSDSTFFPITNPACTTEETSLGIDWPWAYNKDFMIKAETTVSPGPKPDFVNNYLLPSSIQNLRSHGDLSCLILEWHEFHLNFTSYLFIKKHLMSTNYACGHCTRGCNIMMSKKRYSPCSHGIEPSSQRAPQIHYNKCCDREARGALRVFTRGTWPVWEARESLSQGADNWAEIWTRVNVI